MAVDKRFAERASAAVQFVLLALLCGEVRPQQCDMAGPSHTAVFQNPTDINQEREWHHVRIGAVSRRHALPGSLRPPEGPKDGLLLLDASCHTREECQLHKSYCTNFGEPGVTELIPLETYLPEEEWEAFFSSPVFRVQSTIDRIPGVLAVVTGRHLYPNRTRETMLASYKCRGPRMLLRCISEVHAQLRLVGHDARVSWALWDRLAMHWRALGQGWRAMQCLRKASSLNHGDPSIIHHTGQVLMNTGFAKEALPVLEGLVQHYSLFLYRMSLCSAYCDLLPWYWQECVGCHQILLYSVADANLREQSRDVINTVLLWRSALICAFVVIFIICPLLWNCGCTEWWTAPDHSSGRGRRVRGGKARR
eukprot:TRINITY_DN30632_c0_g1_i1.p1 TRINITY_DN30632_c0_g1~~TRINITY_DN30632_c0_g1_i1.p1  ORF type:complete len:365 (+),score=70.17 TRINITY_DN30632_c0_g1_i1:99-1193(+)